jgi:Flp pilus assembly protein TadD
MKKMTVICGFLAAILSAPVVAHPVDNSVTADYEAVAQRSPTDGGAYAELATAYLRDGRVNDAMTAYRRVLKLDNVMLETRTGDAIWSHQVARHALANAPSYTSL